MNHIRHIRKEYLLDELSRFVSSKSGIIQTTYFISEKNTFVHVPMANSITKNSDIGFGVDLDPTVAMIKSLAEALERYVLRHKKISEAILYNKSMEELKSMGYSCFCPDYDVYTDFVYKNSYFKKMSPVLKTHWMATKRFSDNQMMWLPASFMYCFSKLSGNILKMPTSNGMSCSFFDSAVEDSILELIERDTFLYMWLSKKPGEEILFDKISYQPLIDLLDAIEGKRKQIKFIYKYTDTKIPSIYVIFKGKKKYNEAAFFISGSADFDIERGCYRALLEFISIYNEFFRSSRMFKNKTERIKSLKDDFMIKTFFDRTAFYTLYENFNKCEFLFDVSGYKKLSELSKEWSGKVGEGKEELLKNCLTGKNIFIADVTPKEVKKTNARIVRSYSPDLLDLDAGEDILYSTTFKKKRIDLLDKMFKRKTISLNSDPHCYP